MLGGDVHELLMSGDVAGRPHPRVGGAHIVVDDDLATSPCLHADVLQAEAGCARRSAGGEQQLRGAKLAVTRCDRDVAVAAHAGRLDALMELDALLGERVADALGELGFLAARQF